MHIVVSLSQQAESGVVEKKYPNIDALVDAYRKMQESNGLVCALKHPVPHIQNIDDRDSGKPCLFMCSQGSI